MIQVLAFYLFAALTIAAGAFTILSRNPVHSVLWLIVAFFNAAGLMVLAGAEFIAMLLVIVYVGAVAVLFLFVVMMLNINFEKLRAGFISYLPMGILVAVAGGGLLMFALRGWQLTAESRYQLRSRESLLMVNNLILLVATVVVITWFALYALYRLITDES